MPRNDELLLKILAVPFYLKLHRKYNSLLLKYEALEEATKNDVFNIIMDKVYEPITVNRYKGEVKRLRQQVKDLKLKLK